MLEKLPHAVGEALSGLKAGLEKTAYHAAFADIPETLTLTSPAFADGTVIPARFTADGPGTAPPLTWSGVPAGTGALVILVEDAGSPTPQPLVHLIAWTRSSDVESLPEGGLPSPERPAAEGRVDTGSSGRVHLGKNSFLGAEWLPPDPPRGHGQHDYLFQIYAVDRALVLPDKIGRGALLEALRDRVIGKGKLTGTYARD